jgi:hypothetical protein
VELSLPAVEVTADALEAARELVTSWYDGKGKAFPEPKKGEEAMDEASRREAMALRWAPDCALATALTASGVTEEGIGAAIKYVAKHGGRPDWPAEVKAATFLRLSGLAGRIEVPTTLETIELKAPPIPASMAKKQGAIAASPAQPGMISPVAMEMAATLAARGMGAPEIGAAIAGLRAAGLL